MAGVNAGNETRWGGAYPSAASTLPLEPPRMPLARIVGESRYVQQLDPQLFEQLRLERALGYINASAGGWMPLGVCPASDFVSATTPCSD